MPGILKKIGNSFGKFKKIDEHTMEMDNLVVAKIHIKMDLNEGLPKGIGLNYGSTSHWQRLDFVNVPFR
jgi:hypothetical protein